MTTALLTRGTQFGEFRATGYVGSGGFSDVYEAFDSRGQRVALKVLRSKTVLETVQQSRIERERDILAVLDTRGVARLIDADFQSDPPWIASEFIDGPTLRESVANSGPLSKEEALSLTRRVSEILVELHQRGISHRDLTPNNVIFGPAGPVLIDFGSARIDLGSDATSSRIFYGTSGYAPPEAHQDLPVGKAADLFGLARIYQFCVSGSDTSNIELPSALKGCLLEDPLLRPSALELSTTLQENSAPLGRNEKRNIRRLPRRFRLRTLALSILLTLTVSLVGILLLLDDSRPPSTQSLLSLNASNTSDEVEPGELIGFSALPEDWEVTTIRPRDSFHASVSWAPGDLKAMRVAFGKAISPAEGDQYLLATVLASYYPKDDPDLAFGPNIGGSSLSTGLRTLADELVDSFESAYLPNGCSLTSAGDFWKANRTLRVWAASVEGCPGQEWQNYAVGLTWDTSSDLVAQWFAEGDDVERITQFVESLRLEANFSPEVISPGQGQKKIASNKPYIDATYLNDEPERFPFNVSVIRLLAGQSIEVTNHRDTRLQVSAYLQKLSGPFLKQDWYPAGRWWIGDKGERRVFTNPFDDAALFFLEIEGIEQDGQIDITFVSSESKLMKSPAIKLTESLGLEHVEDISFEFHNDVEEFILPRKPSESTDKGVTNLRFTNENASVVFTTSLIPYGFSDLEEGGNQYEQSSFVRADETRSIVEFDYIEAHDAHFFLSRADIAEIFFVRTAEYWVQMGDEQGCLEIVDWDIPTSGGNLFVHANLSCGIKDSASARPSARYMQAAPIYRFTLFGGPDNYEVLVGSFVPESLEDLQEFQRFIKQLIDNGEALAPK